MINKGQVNQILETYGRAWETQDPNLILTIFTPDGTYQDGPFAVPMAGHKEIKAYWDKKIVKEEANIKFKVKKILIDGDESAVEWEAEFDDVVADQRVKMYEAAFLQFRDGKICSLREVWAIGKKWCGPAAPGPAADF